MKKLILILTLSATGSAFAQQFPVLTNFAQFGPPIVRFAPAGGPPELTNLPPRISIRREVVENPIPELRKDEIHVSVDPSCIDLSFDGGNQFLRLGCTEDPRTIKVFRHLETLQVRAMPLGSPEPEIKDPKAVQALLQKLTLMTKQ